MQDPNSTPIEALKLEWQGATPVRKSRIESQLIEENIHLIRKLVTKAARDLGSQLEFADLEQAGSIGVIRAFRAFDPKKGRFSTYAMFWVRKEVREAFADSVGMRKPRLLERPQQLFEVQNRIRTQLGREATKEELTTARIAYLEERTKRAKKPVLNAETGSRLTKLQMRQATISDVQIEDWAKSGVLPSLDAPKHNLGSANISVGSEEVTSLYNQLADTADGPEKRVYVAELVNLMLESFDDLEPRERDGLYMHLYEGKTDKQIAIALGVEVATVRRDRADSIAFLKRRLAK